MISKRGLLIVAGCVWLLAGGALIFRAITHFISSPEISLINIAISFVGGVIFYLLMFRRISAKHINRIKNLTNGLHPFYSFFNKRSYLMMGLMISMGISLKLIGIIPVEYMAYFFPVMATPLILSSLRFYKSALFFHT